MEENKRKRIEKYMRKFNDKENLSSYIDSRFPKILEEDQALQKNI